MTLLGMLLSYIFCILVSPGFLGTDQNKKELE